MRTRAIVYCLLLFGFTETAAAQHAVDPAQRYHRLICLVHLTGLGKNGDPLLPEYAPGGREHRNGDQPVRDGHGGERSTRQWQRFRPGPTAVAPMPRPGILAWSSQITDDGKMAIIHLVAADRGAFAEIPADTRPEICIFEIGVNTRDQIGKEMRKYRKNFNLDELTLPVR